MTKRTARSMHAEFLDDARTATEYSIEARKAAVKEARKLRLMGLRAYKTSKHHFHKIP